VSAVIQVKLASSNHSLRAVYRRLRRLLFSFSLVDVLGMPASVRFNALAHQFTCSEFQTRIRAFELSYAWSA